MLPFLRPRTVAGVIIAKRKPDGSATVQHTEGNEDEGLHACSEALIRAIASKDAKSVTEAIRSAFEILSSEPHEDPDQVSPSPHTYDAQNAKAAKAQE